MNTTVYWIRYEQHSNPLVEGYVGVSCVPEDRWRQHRRQSQTNPALKEAIKNGAQMVILKDNLSKHDALCVEEALRPEDNIGWNRAKGGGSGCQHLTEEQKEKLSKSNTGKGTKLVVYKGVYYPSKTEAARANGVTRGAVSNYKLHAKWRRNSSVTYKGRRYANAKECATIEGVSIKAVYSWKHRHPEEQM